MPSITAAQARRWALFGRSPNEWAIEHVIGRPERYIIGTTGRQVGKTDELADRLDAAMSTPTAETDRTGNPVPYCGILGSNYEKAELSVSRYVENLTRVFGPESYSMNGNKHELVIRDPLAGVVGARLKWLSAEEEYNVVGHTFSWFGVDEAQAISDGVWFKFEPTQAVRMAKGVIFGTPDTTVDQTWFQGLWDAGQDPLDTGNHSFTIASWDAPWMDIEAIKQAKSRMPAVEFRRLYGGEWVEGAGLVFPPAQYRHALLHEPYEWDGTRRCIMAVDFAVTEDFNVVMVGDPTTRTAFHVERWNRTDPTDTYDRILEIWERFGKPKVYADETGMGRIPVRELRGKGMTVYGTTFNAAQGHDDNKIDLLHRLAADLQHRRTMFPAAWDDLRREMGSFVYSRTPAGKLTAGARAGAHDDLVMTFVLLNKGFNQNSRAGSTTNHNYLTGGTLEAKMGERLFR